MENKSQILKSTGIYYFGTQLAQAITLAASILVRRFLGPTQTGIWTALQVVVDYSKYTSMGMMDAAAREIPFHVGRGEPEKADAIKNAAFSFVTFNSILLSLAVAASAFILKSHLSDTLRTGLLLIAAIIFLQRFNNMLIALLRCYKKFNLESGLMIWSALVNAFLVGFFTYHYKIYGFMIAMIISYLFNVAYILRKNPFRFQWHYNFTKFKPLLAFGLPLMALNVAVTILRSLDKILIARWLNFEALGYYSIALMAMGYLNNFPVALGIVLQPYLRETYGKMDDVKSLNPYLLKISTALTLIMSIMVLGVWVLAPAVISLFLPKFTPGIPAMKILVLNIFFTSLGKTYEDYFVTVKHLKPLFTAAVLGILATTAATYMLVQRGWGIEAFAAVTVAASALSFTGLCLWSIRHTQDRAKSLQSIATAFTGILYVFTVSFLIQRFGSGQFLIEALIAAAASLPLILLLFHYFDFYRLLTSILTKKRSITAG